ncbi:MAG: hypothetical protein N4A63_02290 [Vallitalea sp.]|jgi:hypothetical protein|nr:hypothetical protein [Vallitalea sp.]
MKKPQKLLSFSDDNMDILDLLNEKSNASQYVCEAVRFYEINKTLNNNIARIEDKIDKMSCKLDNFKVHQNQEITSDTQVNNQDTHKCIDNELKNLILNEDD